MKKPIGRPKLNRVQYKRNIHPEFIDKMDKYLFKLKNDDKSRNSNLSKEN